MSTLRNFLAALSTGTGRQKQQLLSVEAPDIGPGNTMALIGVLTETVAVSAFTDGGSTSGTYQMAGSVPAGAFLLGSKTLVPAGFAGDTTAALIIGDGSDTDRYNTSTINVFATAATGVEGGVPSGSKLITTANRPTLTITSSTDFTLVKSNASGIVTVSIYFIQTA